MSTTMPVQELAFEEIIDLTGETNFGIDFESVVTGKATIPPEGVRINSPFEGTIKGPKISGKISGYDYHRSTGDGVTNLNIHAVITTDDDKQIAFQATGIAWVTGAVAEVRENVMLYSAYPEYSWVNKCLFWSTGQLDMATGRITFQCFIA